MDNIFNPEYNQVFEFFLRKSDLNIFLNRIIDFDISFTFMIQTFSLDNIS